MVAPAALVVVASNGSMDYGTAPPTITASYDGFVNGDTAASLATQPDLLDHCDALEPGRHLPTRLLGRIRPQLRHRLRRRFGDRLAGSAQRHRFVGSISYGGASPNITAVLRRIRERRHRVVADRRQPSCSSPVTSDQPGRYLRLVLLRVQSDPNYTIT